VDEGIEVTGGIRLGVAPVGAQRVTAFSSPPLAELASVMNRESVNHFAELIFRDAARDGDPSGVGSAATGNALLQQFMQNRVGASRDAVFAADGSGLSTLDRVTARSQVQLLAYANHAPWSREFHETLPVAGRSELLRHRMIATPAQGNLHAKTGTTNSVIALGGYVTSQGGETLAFSFLYNGRERWTAKETIDAMGSTLAAFTR
jgi:D-alanyl-D-alanine carboxypeptidase/D-alanyl-D-alanine-endopeptidase (penicillin-binding protein 4)